MICTVLLWIIIHGLMVYAGAKVAQRYAVEWWLGALVGFFTHFVGVLIFWAILRLMSNQKAAS